jgi:polyphosphate glucokinase
VAEVAFGAGRNVRGVVLLVTFGTGIGSALFLDGRLVPNTELGHLELNGADAELHASDRIREEKDLSWDDWAGRVQDYLQVVERLLSPDLIIIGGGVSKKADRFLPSVKVHTPVVPAVLQNNAGIVGAAMATTGRH